jgi:hypothetical protein
MEAACSSKTSVDFQWTTWCYIPEDRTCHNHHCTNLKFYKMFFVIKGPLLTLSLRIITIFLKLCNFKVKIWRKNATKIHFHSPVNSQMIQWKKSISWCGLKMNATLYSNGCVFDFSQISQQKG